MDYFILNMKFEAIFLFFRSFQIQLTFSTNSKIKIIRLSLELIDIPFLKFLKININIYIPFII